VRNDNSQLWCCFNKIDQRRFEGLSFDEVRALAMAVDVFRRHEWLLWREDWPDWKGLAELIDELPTIDRDVKTFPPDLPQFTEVSSGVLSGAAVPAPDSVIHLESSISGLTASGQFIIRKAQRFKKRLEITILVGDKAFVTHSRDISVGGVYVEDVIPDWIRGSFKIRIRRPNIKQQIELAACLVENQPAHDRVRISILPLQNSHDEKKLEGWLKVA
jgi:hypothetical protein